MEINRMTNVISHKISNAIFVFLLLISTASYAEDIELYLGEKTDDTVFRPKVLIIFDDSGSMDNVDPSTIPSYTLPSETWPAEGDNYLYYTKGQDFTLPNPDDDAEQRKFPLMANNCQTSRDTLPLTGFYTGKIRHYEFSNGRNATGSWSSLSNNDGSDILVLDCKDDRDDEISINAGSVNGNDLPNGYPVNEQGSEQNPVYYTGNRDDSVRGGNWENVTLYTAHYLRWALSEGEGFNGEMRITLAKQSITSLINSTPGVDFGLMTFNQNSAVEDTADDERDDGGRVIHTIQQNTEESRGILTDLITQLEPDGSTPLCESLYEAYRYLSGQSVFYGDNTSETPVRDMSAEDDSNNYISPYTECAGEVNIIIISDGEPRKDSHADESILLLTPNQLSTADVFGSTNNYLPALSGWMRNNDINTAQDGTQTAKTYTIGFGDGIGDDETISDGEAILTETALLGGGRYFFARDSASLTTALQNILSDISPTNNSLTSASVASNNFDRTQTLDSVYYAMFQPDIGPRWKGNIKKYKVSDGVQKGKDDEVAIDALTGHFSKNVRSFWSAEIDGDTVSEGGVAAMLAEKTDRVFYSDLGANNGLVELTEADKDPYSNAVGTNAFPEASDLAEMLDVAADDNGSYETNINNALNWLIGEDVDDDDNDGFTDDIRTDIFGDPLHSKPVVINYGQGNIYIVSGTNHGVVHMFKDNDVANEVDEVWAFMPKEFLKSIEVLRSNSPLEEKIYGVDGLITAHINDENGDGIVNNNDTVWIFFGYRRGGNSYYAMDITKPDEPEVLWTIKGGGGDNGTTGFEELGQTWSQPKVIYSKLNIDGNTAKPALVFGGGYSIAKDSTSVGGGGTSASDGVGKAIYIVDAETGKLIWTLSSAGDTKFSGIDSIPASIGTLDSDGDGLTDRLYAGDTGGNVWRIDMPGEDPDDFSVFKLASLGHETDLLHDRRFFSEPAIVRTYITETVDSKTEDDEGNKIYVQQTVPYDAILIGSGDKTNPLATDVQNIFFMIKDVNINTMQFTATSTPVKPTTPITIAGTGKYGLANYTANPFEIYSSSEDLTDTQKDTLEKLSFDVSAMSGWYINLPLSGEKSTSQALVINNVVYFTTYSPPVDSNSANSCDIASGQGWLYAVDLALGINKYNWSTEDNDDDGEYDRDSDDRVIYISEQFLGAPTLIVTTEIDEETGYEESDGNIIVGRKIMPVGFHLQTLRTFLYITED